MQAAGYPMLGHLFTDSAVPSLDSIVLATTSNPLDNQLVDAEVWAKVRGDEADVMKRVVEAAEAACRYRRITGMPSLTHNQSKPFVCFYRMMLIMFKPIIDVTGWYGYAGL